MGLMGPKKVPEGKETPLVQPLNFRLPVSFHNLYLKPFISLPHLDIHRLCQLVLPSSWVPPP